MSLMAKSVFEEDGKSFRSFLLASQSCTRLLLQFHCTRLLLQFHCTRLLLQIHCPTTLEYHYGCDRKLVDDPINTTRALRTDQSKEEEFASIIEVSKAYTGIYELNKNDKGLAMTEKEKEQEETQTGR